MARPIVMPDAPPASRILVYRYGSIGDFVIAVPSLRLLRMAYPRAEIALLSNRLLLPHSAPAEAILDGTGLIDRNLKYQPGATSFATVSELVRQIAAFKPDLFVYLASDRDPLRLLRDFVFFALFGPGRRLGFPLGFSGWLRLFAGNERQHEKKGQVLLAKLASLGALDFDAIEHSDLDLSVAEKSEADTLLLDGFGAQAGLPLIALSIGTKQPANDWGADNWRSVLRDIGGVQANLVLIGGAADRDRSEEIAADWPHRILNVCGLCTPRVSAAVIRRACLYLGHDSGPMHLAAAVGTPCVAVFSSRNPAGPWFPAGRRHTVLYPCWRRGGILSIRPRQVVLAVQRALAGAIGPANERGLAEPAHLSVHFPVSVV